MGYRHIDTAEMYANEEPIGQALAEAGVPRPDIFLTTKVSNSHLRRADVLTACRSSLERLGLDYIDLYLIHWPGHDVPLEETMQALDELQASGLIRHAGVSNFNVGLMQAAQTAARYAVFCNQVEFNPWERDHALVAVCQTEDILLTAYTPLARGRVLNTPDLIAIGQTHHKTPAQVALRWLTQMDNVVAIPKAASQAHLKENLDVFEFELTPDEIAGIDALG